MPITLTPEQELRLRAYVERGDFGSIEDAALCLLDERLDERDFEADDDLAWAKPLVDEALAEVEAGKTMSREEYQAMNAARLAALKG
jgi:antitoxin ParD1/3/4